MGSQQNEHMRFRRTRSTHGDRNFSFEGFVHRNILLLDNTDRVRGLCPMFCWV